METSNPQLREPLARAKASLKERLIQQVRDQVLADFQNTESAVADAQRGVDLPEAFIASLKEAILEQVRQRALEEALAELHSEEPVLDHEGIESAIGHLKESFKRELRAAAYHQALDELEGVTSLDLGEFQERDGLADATQRIKEHLRGLAFRQAVDELRMESGALPADLASEGELQDVKETMKQGLMEKLLSQAISEIGEDADLSPDAFMDISGDASDEAIFPSEVAVERFEEEAEGDIVWEAETYVETVLEADEASAIPVEETHEDSLLDESGGISSTFAFDASDALESLAFDDVSSDDPQPFFSDVLLPDEEPPAVEPDGVSLIDMHFWEEDAHRAELGDFPLPDDSDFPLPDDSDFLSSEDAVEDDREAEEDPFFLGVPDAPGDGFAKDLPDSFDLEDGQFLLDGEDLDALLDGAVPLEDDLDGDGADDWTPYAESAEDDEIPFSSQSAEMLYIYGISGDGASGGASGYPEGIDGEAPVERISKGAVHALISRVSAADFAPDVLAERRSDSDWNARHAGRHQAIVEQLGTLGALVPAPFGTVVPTEDALFALLASEQVQREIDRLSEHREWRVSGYRDRERLHQEVVSHSAPVQDLMEGIKSQPKEHARELKKKMVSTIHQEIDSLTEACAEALRDEISPIVADHRVREGKSERTEAGDRFVELDVLAHVYDDDRLVTVVEQMSDTYRSLGFSFELSGPRIPLSFASLTADGYADAPDESGA